MKAGIWLDNQKAYIVYLSNGNESIVRVNSDVEDFHVHGGSATPSPYGTHDAVSERRFLERKKHQMNRYYKVLKSRVKNCEAIYICGPANAKLGLAKMLTSEKTLCHKLAEVETCDSMTQNQIIAQVREFFKD